MYEIDGLVVVAALVDCRGLIISLSPPRMERWTGPRREAPAAHSIFIADVR